jgi:type IV pilus assembly protein PilQ
VSALDNEEATVTQGARIPYLSTSQNGTQVQFVEANLELTVTPHITSDNTIFLDIAITNDRPDFSLSGAANGQPGISTKSVDTKILVPDGDTAVLGGVYATAETFSTSRVPGLGDIPVLGYLFKNSAKTRTQNEMLVFITPRIVPIDSGSQASKD